MSFVSVFIPVLLGLLGLGCIAFLSRSLLQGFSIDLRGLRNRLKLQRKERALVMADEAIEKGDYKQAKNYLRDAFYIGGEFESFGFIEKVNSHNLETLDRLLGISEKVSSHFNNLPLIEGLFQSRLELFRSLLDSVQARAKIKSKRKGKDTPDWAFEEFSRKIQDIRDRIEANKKSLNSQLDSLFSDFNNIRSTTEITYH